MKTINIGPFVLNRRQDIGESSKQRMKRVQKRRSKVATTMDWMQLTEVHDDFCVIGRGKKEKILKGYKIIPHDIFLDAKYDQKRRIAKLRNLYNNIPFKLYHAFVFNPVNLDIQQAELIKQYEHEEDPKIQEMLIDDIQKMLAFIDTWKELEFFIMIQEPDGKNLDKYYSQLAWELKAAGLKYQTLNMVDYDNYAAYLFENTLINDYVFARGEFGMEDIVLENRTEVFLTKIDQMEMEEENAESI